MNDYIEEPFDTEPEVGNRDAEIAVLGACFMSALSRKKVRATIGGADFNWPQHEAIWAAMERLEHHGKAIGHPSLIEILKTNPAAMAVLPEIISNYATSDEVESYASIVRALSVRRRTMAELVGAIHAARNPHTNAEGFLAGLVTRFTQLRDAGSNPQIDALTLRELLDAEDEPYDWLIPNLLERGDRLILTGEEGQGKSVLLRQIAVCAAAGLHPFGRGTIEPMKALIIDAENSERQVRRGMRGLVAQVGMRGRRDPRDHVMIECTGRMDITSDMVLSRLHQTIDAQLPDVITIGPMYRLTPKAIQTDDEAAPVLAALDTIKDRGITLLIEAHAGHGHGASGSRNMRPRGSSALLGWPEFGYGLTIDRETEGQFLLERWRGDRDEREWPRWIEHGKTLPWAIAERQSIEWGAALDRIAAEKRRTA
jgi:hypothetical protein